MEFLVDLNIVEDVKMFCKMCEQFGVDVIVRNQDRKFAVDGSSIMALFSLDLSKPVIVHIEDEDTAKIFRNKVSKFVVK